VKQDAKKNRQVPSNEEVDLFLIDLALKNGKKNIVSKKCLWNCWKDKYPRSNILRNNLHARYIEIAHRKQLFQTEWTDKKISDLLICKEKAIQ